MAIASAGLTALDARCGPLDDAGPLMMVLFCGAVIPLVVWAVRAFSGPRSGRHDNALDIPHHFDSSFALFQPLSRLPAS